MSRVKGERIKRLGKLVHLDFGKQLKKGISQNNNKMPTLNSNQLYKKGTVGISGRV